MPVLEVFFDYACPYCMTAHKSLLSLMPQFPQVEIAWRPCEAHPRPEQYGQHSDLCIQGMFIAKALGANIDAYHRLIYRAIHRDEIPIEQIEVLSKHVASLLDENAFRKALQTGQFADALTQANHYAYAESGVWVVPAYRINGWKLDSVEDSQITKDQLRAFIARAI